MIPKREEGRGGRKALTRAMNKEKGVNKKNRFFGGIAQLEGFGGREFGGSRFWELEENG